MVGVERQEQRDDRVPGVSPDRTHQIAADFAFDASGRRHVRFNQLVIDQSDRRRVEDAHVPREPGNHEVFVQVRDDPRRDFHAGVHQQFEPVTEAIRVELLVSPWLSVAPQVEVEDRRQLLGCRRGDELSTGVESTASNQLMQRLRREMRHQPRELRRIEQAREGTLDRGRSAAANTTGAFRHGPAMIRLSPPNKQS